MSDTGSMAAAPTSDEIVLTKQLAKKLHLEHSKRANGAPAPWKESAVEERKLWLGLARVSLQVLKKNGYAKA